MTIIGQRHKIVPQDIHLTNVIIPDITDITDGIRVTNGTVNNYNGKMDDAVQSNPITYNGNNKISCHMIIDVLNDIILNWLTTNYNSIDYLYYYMW